MKVDVPGYRVLDIETVVMDFNGTFAVDGAIREAVKQRIVRLAERYRVYVLTSDTQGTAAKELENLPVTLKIFSDARAAEYKRQIVEELGGRTAPASAMETTTGSCFKLRRCRLPSLKQRDCMRRSF